MEDTVIYTLVKIILNSLIIILIALQYKLYNLEWCDVTLDILLYLTRGY